MRNHEKTETRKPAFQIDGEKLEKVATALGAGDVSECLASDVKHVVEILARVQVLQDIAPGHMDQYLDMFVPHFIKERNKLILADEAQRRADAEGFGEEWRETITAGRHPQQKDFLWKRVQLYMKANNVIEADAIRALAAHLEKDEGDVRRTVARSKSRRL